MQLYSENGREHLRFSVQIRLDIERIKMWSTSAAPFRSHHTALTFATPVVPQGHDYLTRAA